VSRSRVAVEAARALSRCWSRMQGVPVGRAWPGSAPVNEVAPAADFGNWVGVVITAFSVSHASASWKAVER